MSKPCEVYGGGINAPASASERTTPWANRNVEQQLVVNDGNSIRMSRSVLSRLRSMPPLFILCVLVPTLLATIYYGLIASDVYVSESRYIVRTQGKPAVGGLATLLGGGDFGLSGNAMSALGDYALSRDAMNALNAQGRLEQLYSRPEISAADRLPRSGGRISTEDLHEYFTKHVALSSDNQSAIATLAVQAYRPEDAQWINERLLQLGENLANRLNKRSQTDLVRYATREVDEAKEGARRSAVALAAYRNSHSVIDPEKQATISLQTISKLQDALIATKTQIAQMRAFTPKNPQVPVLQNRIRTLEREIRAETLKVAGGKGSLAARTAEYTRLSLESEFSGKLLANALISLQNASNDARRQQVYVERIVQPNLPDEATQPRRWRGIFSVFALGMVAWGLLTLLLSAIREHNL